MHENVFCLVKKLLQLQVQNQNFYGVFHINISVVFTSYTLRKILSNTEFYLIRILRHINWIWRYIPFHTPWKNWATNQWFLDVFRVYWNRPYIPELNPKTGRCWPNKIMCSLVFYTVQRKSKQNSVGILQSALFAINTYLLFRLHSLSFVNPKKQT